MKQISWRELPGNKFLRKFEPEMLTPEGFKEVKNIYPKGAKFGDEREDIEVIYDTQYVIEKINSQVLEPLKVKSLESLHYLLKDDISEAS